MEEKAQAVKKGKKTINQKTLDQKKINLTAKEGKIQCEYCKTRVSDIIRHLKKCHRNPKNTKKIELNY